MILPIFYCDFLTALVITKQASLDDTPQEYSICLHRKTSIQASYLASFS